jgi:hypothetical protein
MNELYIKVVSSIADHKDSIGYDLTKLAAFIKHEHSQLNNEISYIYNKLFPYKRIPLDLNLTGNLNTSVLQVNSIQQVLKLSNLEEYILLNLYVLSCYLFSEKLYTDCEKVSQKLIDVFYRNKRDMFFYDGSTCQANSGQYFELLRFKCLPIYLQVISKKQSIDFLEIIKFHRNSSITNDNSHILLCNFIIKYYIDNKAYQLARLFISRTKFDLSISEKQNIRFYYHKALIEFIIRRFDSAISYMATILSYFKFNSEVGCSNFQLRCLKLAILLLPFDTEGILRPQINCLKLNIPGAHQLKAYLHLIFYLDKGDLIKYNHMLINYAKETTQDNLFKYFDSPCIKRMVLINYWKRLGRLYEGKTIGLNDLAYGEDDIIYPLMKAISDGYINGIINYDDQIITFYSFIDKTVGLKHHNTGSIDNSSTDISI